MSKMNDAMIDFCELSVANIAGNLRKDVEFELTMNRLLMKDINEQAIFGRFLKTVRIVERIKSATGYRTLRWARKLFGAIERMDASQRPELFWRLIDRELSDCFDDVPRTA